MRVLRPPSAIFAALVVVGTSAAWAQQAQVRQGFWIGFGLGWGSLGQSCNGCRTDRIGAASGYLKIGGTLGPRVLLGGEISAWNKSEAGTTTTAGNVSFAAFYYPQAAGRIFVKGGLGLAMFQEQPADPAMGLGLAFGIGYDVRVGRNVSITPVANFTWGRVGDFGSRVDVLQLAVGITFH
jgi:hypothetical protein